MHQDEIDKLWNNMKIMVNTFSQECNALVHWNKTHLHHNESKKNKHYVKMSMSIPNLYLIL